MPRKDCTAAELDNVANVTRHRRRILQAGFFHTQVCAGTQTRNVQEWRLEC